MWGTSQIDDDGSSIRDLKSFISNVQSPRVVETVQKENRIKIQNICKNSKVMGELLCSSFCMFHDDFILILNDQHMLQYFGRPLLD